MLSRHSSSREVGMGSKAQDVGLKFFNYVMELYDCNWMKGVKDCE